MKQSNSVLLGLFQDSASDNRCLASWFRSATDGVISAKFRRLAACAAAAIASIMLVGCASGPKFSDYRRTAPPCSAGQGRIWFYRPSAFGAAVQPAVRMDGRVVGRAVPHGFFSADTTPGPHEVSAATEWTHTTKIIVKPNCENYVQLNMMMGLLVGHVVPEEVPPEKALRKMEGLHLAQ
jgi:hypothetical protein